MNIIKRPLDPRLVRFISKLSEWTSFGWPSIWTREVNSENCFPPWNKPLNFHWNSWEINSLLGCFSSLEIRMEEFINNSAIQSNGKWHWAIFFWGIAWVKPDYCDPLMWPLVGGIARSSQGTSPVPSKEETKTCRASLLFTGPPFIS